MFKQILGLSVASFALSVGGAAFADSIDPTEFSTDLAMGESVTIEKTVVVEESGTSSAVIDAFFLIDTSGSMGSEINNAKTATADIIAALDGFGDFEAGVGVFSEAASEGPGDGSVNNTSFNLDLTSDSTAISDAIDDVTLCVPDCGGSFPESSNKAIDIALESASWRPGSNRFMFVMGDASSNEFVSDADILAGLSANNVDLIGLNFGGTAFADDITDIGGTVFDGGTSPGDIVDAITAGIVAGFANYSEVSVGDLGEALPGIIVSAVCTGADTGVCDGDTAKGDYDRSTDREFTFEVTFTRAADGETSFFTYALVDGGIVARESDRIGMGGGGGGGPSVVPLPASAWLLLAGFGGLAALRRRKG